MEVGTIILSSQVLYATTSRYNSQYITLNDSFLSPFVRYIKLNGKLSFFFMYNTPNEHIYFQVDFQKYFVCYFVLN